MKRIILSLVVIGVVAAGGIGATRAYFSDTAVVTGNTFTAGTMDLVVDSNPSSTVYTWSDGFTNPYNPFSNVKPGDTDSQIVDIKNVGNVDGNVTIKLDATSWSALGDNLVFTVSYDGAHDGTFVPVVSGTLAQFNGNTYTLGPITSASTYDGNPTSYNGKIASVKITWSVPISAGNNIQGKSVVIDTTFGIEQAH